MTRILALETATKNCSVALFENDQLVDFEEQYGAYSHAENLASFAQKLLSRNKLTFADLQAIAVSKGPGSYTGLRIGVSFAKGLCFSLQIPLISVDTLAQMASGLVQAKKEENALYCPMIDARRMEVYAALYNKDLEQVRGIEAEVIDENAYGLFLDQQKVYFLGDGSAKCEEVIQHPNAHFVSFDAPSARYMGLLAWKAYQQKQFENVAYFEPFYLKEFVAIKSKKLV